MKVEEDTIVFGIVVFLFVSIVFVLGVMLFETRETQDTHINHTNHRNALKTRIR